MTLHVSRAKDGKLRLVYARCEDGPAGATHVAQYDLGFRRPDPNLYGAKWKRLEARFLDLLDSEQPLTISAESGRYELPAVNVPDWKKRIQLSIGCEKIEDRPTKSGPPDGGPSFSEARRGH